MLESLLVLDDIKINFSQDGLVFLNITLAFIMFGVALEIKPQNFKQIIRTPKSTIVGIISQFLLLPAFTFLLVFSLKGFISPGVAIGMILVSACPGGNISNFISALSKGNIALSVSLTAFATLAAMFMTPLNFAFWGGLYSSNSSLLVPIEIPIWQLIQTVFLILGFPLIVGMWFNWKFPKITAKITKPMKVFSIVIFFAFVVFAFANNFTHFLNYIKFIIIIVFAHNILAFLVGYFSARITKLPEIDRRTITIETGIQNSGLALVIIFNQDIFPPELHVGGMAFIAAWWGIWHILAGLSIAFFWSRKKAGSR